MSVDVVDESSFAQGRGVDTVEVSRLARHVLDEMRVHPLAELSVLLVDTEAMARLHVQWMDEPGATDVMSFPMDQLRPGREGGTSEPGLLGDVVVCPQVAAEQAAAAGHATADEVLLLVTHGILHLLGYDHAEPDEEREMFTLQRRLVLGFLASIGRPGDPTPTVGHRALSGPPAGAEG
ncbi:rRNA maturation RNase YbeY [Kineococcus sp. R8]|uniref:rRNA maturation RNase YbeY n=1 Tax=Kineococcus siccus TaxID=2696567 RepID=UPI001412436D|nr:rRNA maturation RNase YbeY [Kineococcus siccus]